MPAHPCTYPALPQSNMLVLPIHFTCFWVFAPEGPACIAKDFLEEGSSCRACLGEFSLTQAGLCWDSVGLMGIIGMIPPLLALLHLSSYSLAVASTAARTDDDNDDDDDVRAARRSGGFIGAEGARLEF